MIWSCADCGVQQLHGELRDAKDAHDALHARWERREAKLRELLDVLVKRCAEARLSIDREDQFADEVYSEVISLLRALLEEK